MRLFQVRVCLRVGRTKSSGQCKNVYSSVDRTASGTREGCSGGVGHRQTMYNYRRSSGLLQVPPWGSGPSRSIKFSRQLPNRLLDLVESGLQCLTLFFREGCTVLVFHLIHPPSDSCKTRQVFGRLVPSTQVAYSILQPLPPSAARQPAQGGGGMIANCGE